MITLFSSLIGFLGAMLPDVLGIVRERSDRRYEKEMLELQLRQQAMRQDEQLGEIRLTTDAMQMQALYKTWATGVGWVDALNGSVRPVLAYAFFLLYAGTKAMQFAAGHTLPWQFWNEEDQAIFAGIISFYFGQRAFHKARR